MPEAAPVMSAVLPALKTLEDVIESRCSTEQPGLGGAYLIKETMNPAGVNSLALGKPPGSHDDIVTSCSTTPLRLLTSSCVPLEVDKEFGRCQLCQGIS